MVLQLVKSFEVLKPLIERVGEKPTVTDVKELQNVLSETSPLALQKLQDLLLSRLFQNVLNNEVDSELKCQLLQCVHIILQNIRVTSVETVLRLLSFLMSQVFDSKQQSMIRSVPEELKLIVVKCAHVLITNASDDIRPDLYKTQNIPALSHAVYICVTMAKLEMLQDLRLTSMEIIMSLSLIPAPGTSDMSDPEDRKMIGDAFQFMLPGLISALLIIIQGPITQASKITATAVRTLAGTIALAMEDYDLNSLEPSADSIMALVKSSISETCRNGAKETSSPELEKPHDREAWQRTLMDSRGRPAEWRSNAANKMLPALEEIGRLQSHPHWRVRMEVVWAATIILVRCPRSLYKGLSPLLNALLHLKGDDQPEVRDLCVKTLSEIEDIFSSRASKSFNELIEENMFDLLTKLPRLVQEECGENTPRILSLLAGYIELLGGKLNLMFRSAAHLQRFSLAILQALVLDSSFVILTPEYSIKELKAFKNSGLRAPWVHAKHCANEQAISQVSRLIHALSTPQTADAFDIIGRQLLALMTAVPSVASEAALFLNEMLKTGQGNKRHHLASLVLDTYLELSVYNASSQEEQTLSQSQKTIVRVCIFTEGIGCCIKAMDTDSVHPSLLRAIYPLLERAGSANGLIAAAGMAALTLLSTSTGHADDLVGFLDSNMDYISHCLSTRLRRPAQNPTVFDALTLILRHASQATLPGIRDIINDVFLRSCDEHQDTYAESHLRVFHTFAVYMRAWLKGDCDPAQDDFENDDEEVVLLALSDEGRNSSKWRTVDYILDYHRNLMEAEPSENEDYCRDDKESPLLPSEQPHLIAEEIRNENGNMDEDMDEEEKKPPPPEVLLLDSALRRSLRIIASPNINLQFLALRTVAEGMKTLSDFTDVLLPLAHVTWAPLAGRLRRDQPPLIFRTALGLLCAMAETCKDFLRPRIVKEVIPELSSILESSVKKSHLQDKGSAYRFSQLYKLQKSILSTAGRLCTHLQLQGTDFRPLLVASLPYLSCYQPRPLQKHCFNLIKTLKNLDDDLVWWNIATFWGTEPLCAALKVPPGRTDYCAETTMLLDQTKNQR